MRLCVPLLVCLSVAKNGKAESVCVCMQARERERERETDSASGGMIELWSETQQQNLG